MPRIGGASLSEGGRGSGWRGAKASPIHFGSEEHQQRQGDDRAHGDRDAGQAAKEEAVTEENQVSQLRDGGKAREGQAGDHPR